MAPVLALAFPLGLGGCAGKTTAVQGVEITKGRSARGVKADKLARRSAAAVAIVTTDVNRGMAFVVDPAGYLVTNRHVIEDADHVESIIFPAHEKPLEFTGVEIVYMDPVQDLALLKVETDEPLPSLPFATDEVTPSDHYVSTEDGVLLLSRETDEYGNEVGLVAHLGAISDLQVPNENVGPGDFIELSNDVRQGQSGGPVMDRHGRVIGVVTWTWKDKRGGYAIPIAEANRMLRERPVLVDDSDHLARVQSRARDFVSALDRRDYELARRLSSPSHARQIREETLDVLYESLSPAVLMEFADALESQMNEAAARGGDPFLGLGELVAAMSGPEAMDVMNLNGRLRSDQVVTFFFELGQAYISARVFADETQERALEVALRRIQSLDGARSFALAGVLGGLGEGAVVEEVRVVPGIYAPRAVANVFVPGRGGIPGRRVAVQLRHEWGDWYIADVQEHGAGASVVEARLSLR